MMDMKQRPTEVQTTRAIERLLAGSLPDDWACTSEMKSLAPASPTQSLPDFVVTLTAPDGSLVTMAIEVKRSLLPKDVSQIVSQARRFTAVAGIDPANVIVGAPYLSESTRDAIAAQGVSYADSTGNLLIRSSRPAILLSARGVSKDPWPSDENLRSLKGASAGRAVRALVEFGSPEGLRELGASGGVAYGTLARVVELLDREGLVERRERGPIESVDWQGTLRRWAQDYDVVRKNRVASFVAPRGVGSLAAGLASSTSTYAATGSYAAQRFAPVAPTRLAAVYAADVPALADELELVATDAGANVWLLEPYDKVVFERTLNRDGLRCVNPAQLAVDLLTGPGRDPAEGEALLAWMEGNLDAWRS